MADPEHLDILMRGIDVWNQWRQKHNDIQPDLSGIGSLVRNFSLANLSSTNLNSADLSSANFEGANLEDANLSNTSLFMTSFRRAHLSGADLSNANLLSTDLGLARLNRTNLSGANFRHTWLNGVNFSDANFNGVNFRRDLLYHTVFARVDLSSVRGLNTLIHMGPSTIELHTVMLPQDSDSTQFLRDVGVFDSFIEYTRSLMGKPIDYYSCFISYSNKNEDFAKRLHADLQDNGVRCWFAPEDLKIGDKFRHRIDESIRLYDKLLLVLSEDSLASTWVSYEVERALNKEPEGVPNVLFPIRLDQTILTCETEWAKDIHKSRHIGDFEHWKDHDAYQIAFQRLLRDLKAQS